MAVSLQPPQYFPFQMKLLQPTIRLIMSESISSIPLKFSDITNGKLRACNIHANLCLVNELQLYGCITNCILHFHSRIDPFMMLLCWGARAYNASVFFLLAIYTLQQ